MKKNIKIYPALEFVLENPLDKICYNLEKQNIPIEEVEEIRNGKYLNTIDKYFDIFYEIIS